MKHFLETLALAYQYPAPGSTKTLWATLREQPAQAGKSTLEHFLKAISELTLSEREELFTRTLDLTPLTAPYVAYAVYGEDYRRGTFMAAMNRELSGHFIDTAGELPDHLIPVLRYLAVAEQPLPELLELLGAALKQIEHTLRTLEPKNPYLLLISATQQAVEPILSRKLKTESQKQTGLRLSAFGLGPSEKGGNL